GSADSLLVFDNGGRRLSVLTPTFEYVRSQEIGGRFGMHNIAYENRTFVTANPDLPAQALALLNVRGEVARTYGAAPQDYFDKSMVIGDAGNGAFWAA